MVSKDGSVRAISLPISYSSKTSYSIDISNLGSAYKDANSIIIESTLSVNGFSVDSSNSSARFAYFFHTTGY